MRIVRDTPDRLVVRDRAVLPVLALLTLAAGFATLGTGAALGGESDLARLLGLAFAAIAPVLAGLALFIAREYTHVFDRRQGVLLRRMRRLIGPGEARTIPLERIRGVELTVVAEVADPDTYGIDLLLAPSHGSPAERLPLRPYMSSADLRPVHTALERWLAPRP